MKSDRAKPPRWQMALLQLNRRQIHALAVGLLLFVSVGLYPPWDHLYRNEIGGATKRPAGFHFINAPPDNTWDPTWSGAQVNWLLLSIELMAVAGISAAFIYGFRDRDPQTQRLLRRYEPS